MRAPSPEAFAVATAVSAADRARAGRGFVGRVGYSRTRRCSGFACTTESGRSGSGAGEREDTQFAVGAVPVGGVGAGDLDETLENRFRRRALRYVPGPGPLLPIPGRSAVLRFDCRNSVCGGTGSRYRPSN